jgi:hypothetical protein
MRRPRLAPRGRTPASEERSAPILRQCGHAPGLKGELGEVAFMHKATSLGFALALPYGHIRRYDFIVESGTRLWRGVSLAELVKAQVSKGARPGAPGKQQIPRYFGITNF